MQDAGQAPPIWLAYDEIIPAFSLPGSDGATYGPWDYKQREHLVLLFTSGSTDESRRLLRAFAHQSNDFRAEQCSILAITTQSMQENAQVRQALHLPFPLLTDPQGKVIARYTLWEEKTTSFYPSIVLANRYNALYKQWTGISEATLPPIIELLEALQYLNLLCTP